MATAAWKVAKSLLQLREQIDHLFPNRKKGADGTIGDAVHAANKSDHNPNSNGIVTAMDITHDPANGCNAGLLAEALRRGKDVRLKYVIWNSRMFSSYEHGATPPWTWRQYTGMNRHTAHVHISVYDDRGEYGAAWTLL
jgi:hypothetical protein